MESGPSSNLQAQVPTARGLTALAYCSCCITFVGLGLAANPLGASENIKITTLGHGPAVSHHLVQVRDREEPHLHKLHDGTVILVKGQGYLMMENRRIDLSLNE